MITKGLALFQRIITKGLGGVISRVSSIIHRRPRYRRARMRLTWLEARLDLVGTVESSLAAFQRCSAVVYNSYAISFVTLVNCWSLMSGSISLRSSLLANVRERLLLLGSVVQVVDGDILFKGVLQSSLVYKQCFSALVKSDFEFDCKVLSRSLNDFSFSKRCVGKIDSSDVLVALGLLGDIDD